METAKFYKRGRVFLFTITVPTRNSPGYHPSWCIYDVRLKEFNELLEEDIEDY